MSIPFRHLRRWDLRTALKGLREGWPLHWWALYVKALWYRWRGRWVYFLVAKARIGRDLDYRRLERVFGDGVTRAVARQHNAALWRSRMKLEAMRREIMGVAE